MAVKIHNEDILSHINNSETLAGQVVATHSCITLLDVLKICADVQGDNVHIEVTLMGIKIGGGTINKDHPSITIGGGALGFKAEVTITLNISPLSLKFCGKVCAPLAGCKSGCTTLHL